VPFLGVVVDAVRVGHEPQTTVDGAQLGPVGVRGPGGVPADGAGTDASEHDAGLPDAPEDRVQAVGAPHREEIHHRPAVHPDHVLLEQVTLDVVDVRHREQQQGVQHVPGHPGRLVAFTDGPPLVARRGAEVAQPWRPPAHPCELDGVVDDRPELHGGAPAGHVPAGAGDDGRNVCRHDGDATVPDLSPRASD
jgi:hypothetical protein